EHDDGRAGLRQGQQRVVDDVLRFGGGSGGVEEVADHEHDIDALARGDRSDLGQHLAMLVGARSTTDGASDMPIGSVQDLHRGNPSNGSAGNPSADGLAPASALRVAHEGKGNSSTSGIGSSGWLTIIVPGLMSVAR